MWLPRFLDPSLEIVNATKWVNYLLMGRLLFEETGFDIGLT